MTREHKECEQLHGRSLSDHELALFHAGSVLRAVTGGHGGSSIDAQIDRLAWQELSGNGFWSDEDREFMARKFRDQVDTARRLVTSSRVHARFGAPSPIGVTNAIRFDRVVDLADVSGGSGIADSGGSGGSAPLG